MERVREGDAVEARVSMTKKKVVLPLGRFRQGKSDDKDALFCFLCKEPQGITELRDSAERDGRGELMRNALAPLHFT